MKELTKEEFFKLMGPEVHDLIWETAKRYPDAEGFVLFENLMMTASNFGHRTAVVAGLGHTFKSIEFCEGKWLNDLPSTREHAVSFVKMNNLNAAAQKEDNGDRQSVPVRDR